MRVQTLRFSAAALLLLSGCVKYRPHPIDPPRLERQFYTRSLDDAGLRALAGAHRMSWPPQRLDLASLALVAQYFSPDLALAQARLNTAQAAILTAKGRPNPGVSVGGGWTDAPESPVVFHFDPALTLETAGKRAYRILEAEKLAEVARLEAEETQWRIRSRIRAAYTDHLYALQNRELVRAEGQARSQYVAVLMKRLSAGDIGRPEVELAHSEMAASEVALKSAGGMVAETLAGLAAAAGVPVSAIEAVRIGEAPGLRSVSLERVQRAGLLNRADIRRSLMEYAAAETALQLEVARQYPDVQLAPGYGFDEGHHKFTFGPGFSIPMFNRNRGPIAEAEARRAEAEARFVALQAQAIGEIEKARARYDAALSELAATENLGVPLERREKAVQLAMDAGEEDRVTLTSARIQTALAARTRLEAFRKAQEARGALEDAVEQPLESKP